MFFRSSKGILALDIDGTITAETHTLDERVIHLLHELSKAEWKIIFLTGRPFQWGFQLLQCLSFPYALAVQNGALLIEMPSKRMMSRKYMTKDILPSMESICQKQKSDFVVYSGMENDDWCYYRPACFPSSLLSYVMQRTQSLGEKWQALQTFSQMPVSTFPSLKCFAREEQAFVLSPQIENELGLHAPPNRDPYNPEYFVVQATHVDANKGQVLREFIQMTQSSGPVIAAGNDHNDRSMLEAADVKIVMADAPAALLALADVIAPPADQQGIIQGLTEAIRRLNRYQGGYCA